MLSGIIHVIQKGLRWVDAPARPHKTLDNRCHRCSDKGVFELIFSELPASDAPEPEVLMLDATDVKAHPTRCPASTRGVPPPDWWGMISKLHGVCHSKGGSLWLHLSEGQCSDFTGADVLRKDLPPAATVIGEQGYDSDKICKMLVQQGIPPCRCRKKLVHYSKRLNCKHRKIENLFSRQTDWRGLATRYDRCAPIFRSAILLTAIGFFW